MRTATIYETLDELIEAFRSGALDGSHKVIFDGNVPFLQGPSDAIFNPEEDVDVSTLIYQAFQKLGIPVYLT